VTDNEKILWSVLNYIQNFDPEIANMVEKKFHIDITNYRLRNIE